MQEDVVALQEQRREQREKLFAALYVGRDESRAARIAAAALDRIDFELVIALAW